MGTESPVLLLFLTGCQSVPHAGETDKACIWTVAFSCGHHPGAVDWAGKPSCTETGNHGGRGGKQFGINVWPVGKDLSAIIMIRTQDFCRTLSTAVLFRWFETLEYMFQRKTRSEKVLNMILIFKVQIRWPRRLFLHSHDADFLFLLRTSSFPQRVW